MGGLAGHPILDGARRDSCRGLLFLPWRTPPASSGPGMPAQQQWHVDLEAEACASVQALQAKEWPGAARAPAIAMPPCHSMPPCHGMPCHVGAS